MNAITGFLGALLSLLFTFALVSLFLFFGFRMLVKAVFGNKVSSKIDKTAGKAIKYLHSKTKQAVAYCAKAIGNSIYTFVKWLWK